MQKFLDDFKALTEKAVNLLYMCILCAKSNSRSFGWILKKDLLFVMPIFKYHDYFMDVLEVQASTTVSVIRM